MQTLSNLVTIGLVGLMLTACSDGSSSKKAVPDLFPEVQSESLEVFRERESCQESTTTSEKTKDGKTLLSTIYKTTETLRSVEKFANGVERIRESITYKERSCEHLEQESCYNWLEIEAKLSSRGLKRTTQEGSDRFRETNVETVTTTLVSSSNPDPEEQKALNKPFTETTSYTSLYRLHGSKKILLESAMDGIVTHVDGAITEEQSGDSSYFRKVMRANRPVFHQALQINILTMDRDCSTTRL